MAENLSYDIFPLIPEAASNDSSRPGSILAERKKVAFTIASLAGDAEVPTSLGEIIGVIPIGRLADLSLGSGTASITSLTTDGVIADGAVTVRAKVVGLANGDYPIDMLLLGAKKETVLS